MQEFTVLNDVLPEPELRQMQHTMITSSAFPWYYNANINFDDDPEGYFQFTHVFYQNFAPSSEFYPVITKLISILNLRSLIRIKANLLTSTPAIVEHRFHRDFPERNSGTKSAIFYLNTNDGYTKFEDGQKIESVENRLVIFDGDLLHTGSTCTDQNVRVVINFIYF